MLDLESIERAIKGKDEPFLSDGYVWLDKPHKVMMEAIKEIRRLRVKLGLEIKNHAKKENYQFCV